MTGGGRERAGSKMRLLFVEDGGGEEGPGFAQQTQLEFLHSAKVE